MPGFAELKASDGTGEAAVATIQSNRAISATTIEVDTVDNWPDYFIVVTGTLDANGYIEAASMTQMLAHLDSGDIIIDGFVPGYSDVGNTAGQVAIIKQNTHWVDSLIENLEVAHADDGKIKDTAALEGGSSIDKGWHDLSDTPDTVTHNGAREYDLVFNSVDLTSKISKGTRLRTTRTVVAPVQCADLDAASSQYFGRASGSLTGITFTDDFTVMAWVKRETSDEGDTESIISRYDGTDGWSMRISNGQVELFGNNSGSSNYRRIRSHSMIPAGQWVHVAASLNMSANTGTVWINGEEVQSYLDGSQTSLLQGSGAMQIGSRNTGEYWEGKIAQVGVFSAVLSSASVREYMTRGLTGSETNLVAGYSLSNDITDLSANNNDLTANGGAVATFADAPFGNSGVSTTFDYAIVESISYSTNTTITVKTPLENTIAASGGITSIHYSPDGNPVGWPSDDKVYPWEFFDPHWNFCTMASARLFGKKRVVGKNCQFEAKFVRGGSDSIDAGFGFAPQTSGLEPSADWLENVQRFGRAVYRDDSAGISYMGHVTPNGADRMRPAVMTASATYAYSTLVSDVVPVTDASGDWVEVGGEYELA